MKANYRKGLVLILDGLGDNGVPQWFGATPLEHAHSPHLDQLASRGSVGLVDPLFPGVPVDTHTGVALLFGVPPKQVANLGRGPIEAAGIDLRPDADEVILRCNFATLEQNQGQLMVRDRRAGRIHENTAQLASALQDLDLGEGVRGSLYPTSQHRAILRLMGVELSPRISNTDPVNTPAAHLLTCQPLEAGAAAQRTATAMNRFSELAHRTLREHPLNHRRQAAGQAPANGVLCRSPGTAVYPRSIVNQLQLQTAVVAGERTLLGLARLLGYSGITNPSFSSMPDTDVQKKVAVAMDALKHHDLVFLHVKGTDICSHDRDPAGKRDLIERIDQAIRPLLETPWVVAVTADHSTDSQSGLHTGDPVPSLICSPTGRRDAVTRFGEQSCAQGGLGRISGYAFTLSVLNAMGRMQKFDHNNWIVEFLDLRSP